MAVVGDFVSVKWNSNIKKKKNLLKDFGVMKCAKLMSSELKCSGDLELQHWAQGKKIQSYNKYDVKRQSSACENESWASQFYFCEATITKGFY